MKALPRELLRDVYVIDNAEVAMPLMLRYAWHIRGELDLAAMRAGVAPLRGRHDFSAFCAAPGRDRDPRCTVRSIRVVRKKGLVGIFLSADSFLHHMARNIVGSAVEVGLGRREPAWLDRVRRGRQPRRPRRRRSPAPCSASWRQQTTA